jgi:hypothetical protein
MAANNPFLVELFKDPKFLAADLQYVAERHKAVEEASRLETTSMNPQNQAQAATMRIFDAGGNRDTRTQPSSYSDTKNYPLDQGIMNLPNANANALARRQANIAMTDLSSKVAAKKRVTKK